MCFSCPVNTCSAWTVPKSMRSSVPGEPQSSFIWVQVNPLRTCFCQNQWSLRPSSVLSCHANINPCCRVMLYYVSSPSAPALTLSEALCLGSIITYIRTCNVWRTLHFVPCCVHRKVISLELCRLCWLVFAQCTFKTLPGYLVSVCLWFVSKHGWIYRGIWAWLHIWMQLPLKSPVIN